MKSSSGFSISPIAALKEFIKTRELIAQLVWSEVVGRYRGSFAGFLWSFLNPLFSLAMYTFVFGVVFKARWGLSAENTFDFSMVLFTGLIVHGLVSETINRAPYLILSNPSYVKQVVFPLEVLPVVALGSSLFHAAISFLLLIVIWSIAHGSIALAVAFIPLLILPLSLITVGVSWFMAAATVYFRDLGQLVTFISSGLLFFSPIFYPVSSVPESFRIFLELNPLTYIIEQVRATLISGEIPELKGYVVYFLVSAIVAWAGYAWFQKTRAGFADVI
ncbi:ABC-type polysaccharide/polyol phosphate export systems permease component [Nitrosococcus oceani ATCC 19707]|uniref:Transport permease protein n=2 Tax=Nitrosococcus oceani TaxID=1229 RepID=Q3JBR8_NITOC|nr:ABC transporter permease [Nitrosococcus oceani]ABA57728.1 ABC-type polysaccharide/polyol phosphate export systems permease component [Nitrosococcus oceani ATCC 19707]EDZ67945.1 ABC-2 type transporter superfamily [Nitrosococcus oceani AFC27]KFI19815.1 sugar ABC transporter permease [Nitrosococcus oceani C-27]GEM19383.1 sugar ABC transporter permease [Nitrosococcus oceani]